MLKLAVFLTAVVLGMSAIGRSAPVRHWQHERTRALECQVQIVNGYDCEVTK